MKYLERAKVGLVANDNISAASTVDSIIGELTELAQNHVSDLEKFEAKIKNNGDQLKIEVKTSSDKLKVKFNLEGKKHDEDNNDEDENDEEDEKDHGNNKVIICHMPPGNGNNGRTIEISGEALQTHLSHGDALGKCDDRNDDDEDEDEDDDNSTSTPDTLAPVISNVHSNPATTTANVIWTTNELATSNVWYATTTPLVIMQAPWFASSTNPVAVHNLSLTGLNASTTYYFIVGSKDTAGNQATSSEYLFSTL